MRARRVLGWTLLAIAVAACVLWPREPAGKEGSFAARLLGPIGSLAASGQWVRVRVSWQAGRIDRACAQAEVALELDPGATEGWAFLAAHFAYDAGGPARERDPAMRTRWVEAALELLERGERTARRPAELALQRGSILVQVGSSGGVVPWKGGLAGAWTDAQAAFERAVELDPGLAEGWAQLAANRTLRLAGPALEPDPEARVRGLEEALAILEAGEARARDPRAALAFQRGVLLELFARSAGAGAHPLGRGGLYEAAIEAYARAGRAGHPLAGVAETSARKARRETDEG